MSILSQDFNESDFIPYIKDEYEVDVSIPRPALCWAALNGYNSATIGPHIAKEIGNMWIYNDEHMKEQVRTVVNIMLDRYFDHKYSNGLNKKFNFYWSKTTHGFVCKVYDDLRDLYMKITFTDRKYTATGLNFRTFFGIYKRNR